MEAKEHVCVPEIDNEAMMKQDPPGSKVVYKKICGHPLCNKKIKQTNEE